MYRCDRMTPFSPVSVIAPALRTPAIGTELAQQVGAAGQGAGEVRPEIQRRRIACGVAVVALRCLDPGRAETGQPAALSRPVVERRIAVGTGGAALEHGRAEREPAFGCCGVERGDVHPRIVPLIQRARKMGSCEG